MVGADWSCRAVLQAEPLAKAIESEKVTVPARTHDLDRPAALRRENDGRPVEPEDRPLRRLSGAAHADQNWQERHGLKIIQAWGMTETSPLGLGRAPARGL